MKKRGDKSRPWHPRRRRDMMHPDRKIGPRKPRHDPTVERRRRTRAAKAKYMRGYRERKKRVRLANKLTKDMQHLTKVLSKSRKKKVDVPFLVRASAEKQLDGKGIVGGYLREVAIQSIVINHNLRELMRLIASTRNQAKS